MKLTLIASAIVAGLTAGASNAATLDFVAFGAGTYGPSISLPGATITNVAGGNILVGAGAAGQADGFCSLVPGQFNCATDTNLVFDSAVTNLSFDLDGSNTGDNLALSIFGLADVLITTLFFTTPDQHIDLAGLGTITRLFFDDSSSAAGYGYSTFVFDTTAAVPLPAGLPLLVGGVAALVGLSRRKRRA
jgi:hypothetical protein